MLMVLIELTRSPVNDTDDKFRPLSAPAKPWPLRHALPLALESFLSKRLHA